MGSMRERDMSVKQLQCSNFSKERACVPEPSHTPPVPCTPHASNKCTSLVGPQAVSIHNIVHSDQDLFTTACGTGKHSASRLGGVASQKVFRHHSHNCQMYQERICVQAPTDPIAQSGCCDSMCAFRCWFCTPPCAFAVFIKKESRLVGSEPLLDVKNPVLVVRRIQQ